MRLPGASAAAASRTSVPSAPRGGRQWAAVALGAAAVVAVLALVAGVVSVPSVGDLLADASDSIGAGAYLAVPALAFLETAAFVGLLVPGETAVIVGGVVAERGEVSLAALVALVWAAAVAGDVVSFLLGRRLGRRFLVAHGQRVRVGPEQIAGVERFFARHGGKAVLLGRFVGVLRALTPFVAGTSGLALRRFLPYSAAGALAWASAFTLVGYAFSGSFASAGEAATRVTLAAVLLIAAVLALVARRQARVAPSAP